MKEIRTLLPSEIDCRVGTVVKSQKAITLLLYKDARVDMQMLDELVGPENWQRDHKELKGHIYCGVGIRDNNDGQWIWKWDCGAESNTDPEKGEASDSFKRACVNWGIGRELYTAPFIYLKLDDDKEWNDGKPKVKFRVDSITYDKDRSIKSLVLVDNTNTVRYTYGVGSNTKQGKTSTRKAAAAAEAPAIPQEALPQATVNQDFDKATIPDGLEFKPLAADLYDKVVRAAAYGEMTKSGMTMERWYTKTTHAGDKEYKAFLADVSKYKKDNNIQ